MRYPVLNLGQSTWQLLQPYGGWGYNPPPPSAPPPAAPPAPPPPPEAPGYATGPGYVSQMALDNAYKAYQDAVKNPGSSQEDISRAFSDYKAASDKDAAEQPLRDEMESLAKQAESIASAKASAPTSVTGTPPIDYTASEKTLLDKMEQKWPGWYQAYLDNKIYQYTGGQPEWYRNLKDKAASLVDIALQVAPFLPYAKGAAGGVRQWVATPGRAPAPTLPTKPFPFETYKPVPTPTPTPAPFPTIAPRPVPSASEVWQRYNQQLQESGGPPPVMTPSGGGLPPMSPGQAVPIPTQYRSYYGGEHFLKPAVPSVPSEQNIPVIRPSIVTGYKPPSETTTAPTAKVPAPVATPGAGSTSHACPPGQFWDGMQCRGSISPQASSLISAAGGLGPSGGAAPPVGTPTGGYSPAGIKMGGIPVLNIRNRW